VRMLCREPVGSAAGDVEYIVRAQNDATIAVVQSAVQGLRWGDRVSTVRSTPPTIEPNCRRQEDTLLAPRCEIGDAETRSIGCGRKVAVMESIV
jgi:hypothetical protein